jgi:hypothetical protein
VVASRPQPRGAHCTADVAFQLVEAEGFDALTMVP